MALYRIFFVIGAQRSELHVPVDVECNDDEDACKRARQYLNGHDLEVWRRGDFVARISRRPSRAERLSQAGS